MSRLKLPALAAAMILAAALGACMPPAGSLRPSPSIAGPGIVAEVATYELVSARPGRLLVALPTANNRWVSFGSVEMSFAYLGDRTQTAPTGVGLEAATADFLPIPGTPEGDRSLPTITDPADGRGVYAVEPITFPKAGFWRVTAHGSLGDGTAFSADAAFEVLDRPTVVGIGDEAPRSDNAVAGAPGVEPVAIDSRAADGAPIPDPELHTTSIADAIAAGNPALVVFSTPVYCVSRFCGPVTDMVRDLAATFADRADFIHVEIYKDFEAGIINPAAAEWLQGPTGDLREPWTFLIGADGRIAGSWDTLVTRAEIEPLLQTLPPK